MNHETTPEEGHIVLDADFAQPAEAKPRDDAWELKSSKPKATIPMPLPWMKKEPAFTPEVSPQQDQWWKNDREWQSDFRKSAEAYLQKSGFPKAVVKDFRSLLGEKDEHGYDMGYDENDFEIEFQYGSTGDKVGEGNVTTEHWKVRRVEKDDLQS